MDSISKERRSANMRRIRSKDTAPEILVRRLCRQLGFSGYRLHKSSIPGSPDIAWIGRKKAVFVHGCFWHGHSCKEGARKPKSNSEYWVRKISVNIDRDSRNFKCLDEMGWSVLVIWECELRSLPYVQSALKSFLAIPAESLGID
jgi:DNA mismatch endonuclease (patch repair protein)